MIGARYHQVNVNASAHVIINRMITLAPWLTFICIPRKKVGGDGLRTEEPRSKIQTVLRELYHELKASTDDGSINPDTLDEFYDNVIEPLYKKSMTGTRGDAHVTRFLLELEDELPIRFESLWSKNGVNRSFEQICELLEREPKHLETICGLIEEKYPKLDLSPNQKEEDIEKFKEEETGEIIKIGKNELQILKMLDENPRPKRELREGFHPEGDRTVALSRALGSLSRKGLIMKYAKIDIYDEWEIHGEKLFRQPYQPHESGDLHKSKLRGPLVDVFLGLSRKGLRELRKRE